MPADTQLTDGTQAGAREDESRVHTSEGARALVRASLARTARPRDPTRVRVADRKDSVVPMVRIKRWSPMAITVIAFTVLISLAGALPAFGIMIEPTNVFRFYNQSTGSHFYTASASERDTVMSAYVGRYTYEGVAWRMAGADWWEGAQTAPLYRFYNTKNGSHFYTTSEAEKAKVLASYGATYTYEGVAYDVYLYDLHGEALPVYRFYNKANGSHFYTISEAEKATVRQYHSTTYTYEGIAFYALPRGTHL